MDDLDAKIEQERKRVIGILRTLADKLEGLSIEGLAEPLTLLAGSVAKLDEWMRKLWRQRMPSYVAVLRKEPGSDYSVNFPDLPGCMTAGRTAQEAHASASEVLALHVGGFATEGLPIPAPRTLDAIRAEPEHEDATLFLCWPIAQYATSDSLGGASIGRDRE